MDKNSWQRLLIDSLYRRVTSGEDTEFILGRDISTYNELLASAQRTYPEDEIAHDLKKFSQKDTDPQEFRQAVERLARIYSARIG